MRCRVELDAVVAVVGENLVTGLDEWRGTSPWFLLGGLALGIVVGFYELVKTVRRK